MVTHMVGVGEETGALETMLSKVADFYEDQVAAAVKALTSILEPMMIIVVGAIVGFIVIAMYMPMFRSTTRSAERRTGRTAVDEERSPRPSAEERRSARSRSPRHLRSARTRPGSVPRPPSAAHARRDGAHRAPVRPGGRRLRCNRPSTGADPGGSPAVGRRRDGRSPASAARRRPMPRIRDRVGHRAARNLRSVPQQLVY
jgi:hypothetical protein